MGVGGEVAEGEAEGGGEEGDAAEVEGFQGLGEGFGVRRLGVREGLLDAGEWRRGGGLRGHDGSVEDCSVVHWGLSDCWGTL